MSYGNKDAAVIILGINTKGDYVGRVDNFTQAVHNASHIILEGSKDYSALEMVIARGIDVVRSNNGRNVLVSGTHSRHNETGYHSQYLRNLVESANSILHPRNRPDEVAKTALAGVASTLRRHGWLDDLDLLVFAETMYQGEGKYPFASLNISSASNPRLNKYLVSSWKKKGYIDTGVTREKGDEVVSGVINSPGFFEEIGSWEKVRNSRGYTYLVVPVKGLVVKNREARKANIEKLARQF